MELPGAGGWRSRWGQALVSCGYVVLLAASFKLGPGPAGTALLGLFAAVGFFAWGATYRRVRAMTDIATSRIGTAAQGYVELVGRASAAPDDLIRSPLGGVSCVWYRFRRYSRDSAAGDWQLVDSGVRLVKLWLDVSRKEQKQRLEERGELGRELGAQP
jgi:hypothetical protein